MKRCFFIFTMVLSSVVLFSCSEENESNEEDVVQRTIVDLIPKKKSITLTDNQKTLMNNCNDFAFNLYRQVHHKTGSHVLSPLSVAFILSLINNGAEGTTSDEIMEVLGFNEANKAEVNKFCANLIENAPNIDPNVQIYCANALFVNKEYTLLSDFENDSRNYYHAEAKSLDFSDSSSADEINEWCREKTDGNIRYMLEKSDPSKIAYLLNAIFFKATWTDQFDPKHTRTESFHREDGSTAQLPMMQRYAMALVSYDDNYTSICLPYSSGAFNMYVLLPDKGCTTSQIVENLNAESFNKMIARTEKRKLQIKIPRFTASLNIDLKETLTQMGIKSLFTEQAELPYITKQKLFISEIRHSAKIEVDEQGTKTAAVTMAEIAATAAEPPKDFIADRPFVYLIQENTSGAIFFIGTYMGD